MNCNVENCIQINKKYNQIGQLKNLQGIESDIQAGRNLWGRKIYTVLFLSRKPATSNRYF